MPSVALAAQFVWTPWMTPPFFVQIIVTVKINHHFSAPSSNCIYFLLNII